MAAVLHGAPVTTLDIDLVHSREQENIKRLLRVLSQLKARYRGQPEQRILLPTADALSGTGHNNLSTDLGPIDLLCELSNGQGYEQLLPHTEEMTDAGISLKIITLEKLIEIKAATGRAKDQLILPLLMKLLDKKARD
ncbi:MAG: hypothetical protein QNJ97_29025 [Myxococcota bacterium]|nr:hypothetical protein [Myxococcota bacterium]